MTVRASATFVLVLVLLALAGCGDDSVYSVERLQDPTTCKDCHATHYTQWSGSMHAYAARDPVFLAMNKRGQRETNGALGTFCLNCHAPMAVANGTVTAANAADFDPTTLTPAEDGITCYFCHNVDKVTADHNNGIVLAMDQTMRGGAKNPVQGPAHRGQYDPLMDSDTNQSEVCGSCHDIVLPNGVPLERTFAEWKTTFFATQQDAAHHLTCGSCHMKPKTGVIADGPGLTVPSRAYGFHEHTFPAIDQALIPFPELAAQAAGIKEILDPAIAIIGPTPLSGPPSPGGICVEPLNGGQISVRVDSIGTGHSFPSGSAQDRRVWIELVAYRADNSVVFQSGVVPDGVDPEDAGDPNLFGLWDRTYTDASRTTRAHFFWDVGDIDSQLLKGPTTLVKTDPAFDHSTTKRFPVPGVANEIDHISARIRVRPLPYAMLHRLEQSGDLDPAIASHLVTLEIAGTMKTWTRAAAIPATGCNP